MKRSKHQLSRYQLATCDMGQLIPVGLTEILPMDTVRCRSSALIRVSPMQAPVMHPVTVRLHHFFVPHRIVWDGWENFITGGPDGNDSSTIPTVTVPSASEKDLFDYYGVKSSNTEGLPVNALPIRGYNAIFNEWYRDQDLVSEVAANDTNVLNVAWEKDYFTAARPWTQKGSEVTLPLAGEAPVKGLGVLDQAYNDSNIPVHETGGSSTRQYSQSRGADANLKVEQDPNNTGYPGIFADLSRATAASVNDVRTAFALQRYQEARSRHGSRYTEYLRFLGANPGDDRLQRPELLAGSKARVAISEVLQTANEPTQQRFGVGDLYGHGVTALRGAAWQKHFNEHGYVHTLMSVRPRAMYTQGMDRTWLRQDKEDFWQRELQYIGQQAVYNGELYTEAAADLRNTFGYNDRYREYREARSYVTGEFRKVLDYWHLGRIFSSQPVLNESFVKCVPSKRIYNEQTAHSLWCMIQHRMVARRLVSRSAYARII